MKAVDRSLRRARARFREAAQGMTDEEVKEGIDEALYILVSIGALEMAIIDGEPCYRAIPERQAAVDAYCNRPRKGESKPD